MRLKLDLKIGNGYLYGNAANDSMSYKINIELARYSTNYAKRFKAECWQGIDYI